MTTSHNWLAHWVNANPGLAVILALVALGMLTGLAAARQIGRPARTRPPQEPPQVRQHDLVRVPGGAIHRVEQVNLCDDPPAVITYSAGGQPHRWPVADVQVIARARA
jgi:hypothetical protein